ncbi:FadR/GntR family transcriptional regulator [Salinicola halophyticus]|uniref:FadR/GntR family transcriptional regulator n=1 Tax=Salinicola halophyticus TaxID=1808881 RepID=UPI003F4686DE
MPQPTYDILPSDASSLPASLTDHLVRSVIRLVHQEQLGADDRLPAIRAMAERFAVAVPTMREAVRRLEVLGLVEVRHGSGVYVKNTSARIVFGNPGATFIDPETILELLDARLALEPVLAAKAAEQITQECAKELEEVLKAAGEYLFEDHRLHELNMKFHCLIAQASGNKIMSQTLQSYTEIYSGEQTFVLRLQERRKRVDDHAEHEAICRAIVGKEPDQAYILMKRHLVHVIEKTKKNLSQGSLLGETDEV